MKPRILVIPLTTILQTVFCSATAVRTRTMMEEKKNVDVEKTYATASKTQAGEPKASSETGRAPDTHGHCSSTFAPNPARSRRVWFRPNREAGKYNNGGPTEAEVRRAFKMPPEERMFAINVRVAGTVKISTDSSTPRKQYDAKLRSKIRLEDLQDLIIIPVKVSDRILDEKACCTHVNKKGKCEGDCYIKEIKPHHSEVVKENDEAEAGFKVVPRVWGGKGKGAQFCTGPEAKKGEYYRCIEDEDGYEGEKTIMLRELETPRRIDPRTINADDQEIDSASADSHGTEVKLADLGNFPLRVVTPEAGSFPAECWCEHVIKEGGCSSGQCYIVAKKPNLQKREGLVPRVFVGYTKGNEFRTRVMEENQEYAQCVAPSEPSTKELDRRCRVGFQSDWHCI